MMSDDTPGSCCVPGGQRGIGDTMRRWGHVVCDAIFRDAQRPMVALSRRNFPHGYRLRSRLSGRWRRSGPAGFTVSLRDRYLPGNQC